VKSPYVSTCSTDPLCSRGMFGVHVHVEHNMNTYPDQTPTCGDEHGMSVVTQRPVRDFAPAHAGLYARGNAKRTKKGLTPAAASRTMPRTHHHFTACERGTPACRRRPLTPARLATLALRQLNRQPAGVPAALASSPLAERGIVCLSSVSEPEYHALHSVAAKYHAGMCDG